MNQFFDSETRWKQATASKSDVILTEKPQEGEKYICFCNEGDFCRCHGIAGVAMGSRASSPAWHGAADVPSAL